MLKVQMEWSVRCCDPLMTPGPRPERVETRAEVRSHFDRAPAGVRRVEAQRWTRLAFGSG